MRLTFLLRMFFMVHMPGGARADEACELPSITTPRGYKTQVNQNFIASTSNCTEWTGKATKKKNVIHTIYMDEDVTPEIFDQAFANVKRIKKISFIEIIGNKHLKTAIFPNLETVEFLSSIYLSGCPELKTVSFPKLQMKYSETTVIQTLGSQLEEANLKALKKQLSECFFAGPISNASLLNPCENMHHLEFAKGATGTVDTKITSVEGYLRIVDTRLHSLNFLKLPSWIQKNGECVITGNRLCEYDDKTFKEMILDHYPSCTVENNKGGYCGNMVPLADQDQDIISGNTADGGRNT